jgi:hypothetical protein
MSDTSRLSFSEQLRDAIAFRESDVYLEVAGELGGYFLANDGVWREQHGGSIDDRMVAVLKRVSGSNGWSRAIYAEIKASYLEHYNKERIQQPRINPMVEIHDNTPFSWKEELYYATLCENRNICEQMCNELGTAFLGEAKAWNGTDTLAPVRVRVMSVLYRACGSKHWSRQRFAKLWSVHQ